MPPKYKQPSGNEKRRKKQRTELFTKSIAGSIDRYVQTKPKESQSITDANMVIDEDTNVNCDEQEQEEEQEQEQEQEQVQEEEQEQEEGANNVNAQPVHEIPLEERGQRQPFENFDTDPNTWKLPNQSLIDFLVKKGPIRVEMLDSEYPRDDRKRHFAYVHYTRRLHNGEKYDRRWLVYSKSVDRVFCFCCKLFKLKDGDCNLDSVGYNDWHNIGRALKQHESSNEHMLCFTRWFELEERLEQGKTIDKRAQELILKEKERLKEVMFRIIGAIKHLAKNNMAFRGSNEKLYAEDNGNFLSLMEYVSSFDHVMKDHIQKFENKDIQYHYLSHKIQNEFIGMVSNEVKVAIIKKIKTAKYFSVILDCTPDASREEQMTLLIRCVQFESPIKVEEYFLGFLKVRDTTGLGLFLELQNALTMLGLNIDDIRGQGYDNGSNMKGPYKGVQSRLLEVNSRAFYTPCACHSLNLALCDMARSSIQADHFFASVQRLYTLFSTSPNRWDIFKEHVSGGLTLKSLSTTR